MLSQEMKSMKSVCGAPQVSDTFEFVNKRKLIFKQQIESKQTQFKFDRVFSDAETQEDVYNEVKDVVKSALDGQNVCIFAYGQTGSGKTYTMQGDRGDPSKRGIIQRAVSALIKRHKENLQADPSSRLKVSCFEIHIETVCDLLTNTKQTQLMTNSEWSPFEMEVNDESDVHSVLAEAFKNR